MTFGDESELIHHIRIVFTVASPQPPEEGYAENMAPSRLGEFTHTNTLINFNVSSIPFPSTPIIIDEDGKESVLWLDSKVLRSTVLSDRIITLITVIGFRQVEDLINAVFLEGIRSLLGTVTSLRKLSCLSGL